MSLNDRVAAALVESADCKMEKSVLSDKAILAHMQNGTVVIEPFTLENLSTSSYDVTLGRFYYRESDYEPGSSIFNPYSQAMVKKVGGEPREAELCGDWMKRSGQTLENISASDRIIWLKPGETILGHTNEFLGGRGSVTTMMKARSSLGRTFVETCKCAGWGDVGFLNRWTMEITNNSRFYSIPLVVGRRIAQIVFFDTDGTLTSHSYEKGGKYQTDSDIETLVKNWQPSAMLPKMWLDREIKQGPAVDILVEKPNERYTPVKRKKTEDEKN